MKLNDKIDIYFGDCLQLMPNIPDKSIDMILCDLPFNTTSIKWDSMIPFEPLWKEYRRIIKDQSAIVLFGSQPFTAKLVASNLDWYRYEMIWEKTIAGCFTHAKNMPMKKHENIEVFSPGNIKHFGQANRMNYFPQGLIEYNKMTKGHKIDRQGKGTSQKFDRPSNKNYVRQYTNYPDSVLHFASAGNTIHPTQKPVNLLEYLIKTYTTEGMLVLDNCAGSFSTGVACVNTDRRFIGMEMEEEYFDKGKSRLGKVIADKERRLF